MEYVEEEEVLEQGTSYKESGSSEDNLKDFKEKKDEIDIDGVEVVDKKFNPMLLIPILIGVAALIFVIVIGLDYMNKKAEAEEQARMEALLAEEEIDEPVTYTSEEIEELRKAGYTGTEIEAFEFEEIPAQIKIDEAAAERKALYEKEVAPYFDMATDEFKEVYADTWLGQADLAFSSDTTLYTYYSEIMNVDYEKLPAKGNQLFIKFYLPNDKAGFMTVTPERYVQLASTGNIVLEIKYTQTGDGSRIITSTTEIIP